MKSAIISAGLVSLAMLPAARAVPHSRRSSNSFAGSNLYFLHGLSASDHQAYQCVAPNWVNGLSAGCVKGSHVVGDIAEFETSIGQYNYDTLAQLDAVLAQTATKGIKAIISPHDGNESKTAVRPGMAATFTARRTGRRSIPTPPRLRRTNSSMSRGMATSYRSDFNHQAADINGAGYPWLWIHPNIASFNTLPADGCV
jgi:hypothetical protein